MEDQFVQESAIDTVKENKNGMLLHPRLKGSFV